MSTYSTHFHVDNYFNNFGMSRIARFTRDASDFILEARSGEMKWNQDISDPRHGLGMYVLYCTRCFGCVEA